MKSFFSPGFSSVCCLVSFSLFFLSPLPFVLVSPPPHFLFPLSFLSYVLYIFNPVQASLHDSPHPLPILAAGALPALDINQMDLLVMLDKRRNIFLELLINRLCRILDKSMLMNVFLLPPCLSLDPPASVWFSPQCVPPSGETCSLCAPRQTLSVLYLAYARGACMHYQGGNRLVGHPIT